MATAFGVYISCKWPVMVDNDMGISYKGWLVFSQPLRLLVALSGFAFAAVGSSELLQTLGIDTLIANICL